MAEGEYLPYPRLGSVACCRGSSRLCRGSVAAMLRLVAALSRLRRGSVAARRGSVAARCGRVAAPSQACRGCRAGVAQVSRRCRALSRCVAGMLQKNRLLSRFCCGVSLVSRAIFFLSKPRHVLGHPLEGGVTHRLVLGWGVASELSGQRNDRLVAGAVQLRLVQSLSRAAL